MLYMGMVGLREGILIPWRFGIYIMKRGAVYIEFE